MAIFDSDLGFMPLPQSQQPVSNVSSVEVVGISGSVNEAYNDLIELPVSATGIEPGLNLSNSLVDQIFTGIEDVSNMIHLPVPESIKEIYGVTQYVEGVISDPLNEAKRLASRALFNLFDPDKNGGNEGMLPRFQGDKWAVSEEQKKEFNGNLKINKDKKVAEGNSEYSVDKPADLNPYDQLIGNPNVNKNNKDVTGQENTEDNFQFSKGDPEPQPNFEFNGRETVKNLTMRLNHLWDMSIIPYDYKGVPNTAAPPMDIQEGYAFGLNQSPYYENALTVKPDKIVSNTNLNYVPILSYDMDIKTLVNKEVELFSGSSIAVPEVIRYTSHLSMQILDDENKRWRRWFQTYTENLYEEETALVKPYKNSCLQVTLYQYRSDRKIISRHTMLVNLKNYQMISSGTGMGNADIIDVEFSIVGEIDIPEDEKFLTVI